MRLVMVVKAGAMFDFSVALFVRLREGEGRLLDGFV